MKISFKPIKKIVTLLGLLSLLVFFVHAYQVFAGSSTFDLYYSAGCPSGSYWNGSSCVYPAPTPSLAIYSTWGIADGSTSGYTYQGGSYTVSWGAVANATSCTLDGAGVSPSGGSSSGGADGWGGGHTFTLTCSGSGGSGSAYATIYYPLPPTITSYSCNSSGTSATVSWSDPMGWGTFYPRASLGGNYQYPPTSDSATGTSTTWATTPGGAYTFWIHTRHPGNAAWSSAVWAPTINCPNPAPTVSVSASPTYIGYTGSSTVYWSSSNATSCTGPGGTATSGAFGTGTLYASQTYTMTCSGPGGSGSASATVTVEPAPSGWLSASPTSCTIGLGASTCASRLSWDTYYPVGGSVIAASGMSSYGMNSSGGTDFPVPYGGRTFYLYNNGSLLAQTTVSASCTGGTGWNGSSCVGPATVSVSASPTYIGYTGSSTVYWSSSNATSCTGPGGTATSGAFGTGTLYASQTYTMTCSGPGGSGSASATVTVEPAPSGWLSASPTPCTIGLGASSCSTSLSWGTSYPIGTSAITASGMTSYSANGSGGTSFEVPYGGRTFYLYNNGYLLSQNIVGASCTAGTGWNGSACVGPATVSLSASPSSVGYNSGSTLTWSSANATSCSSAYGGGSGVGGSFATGNLTSTTSYTVYCNGPGGTGSSTATVTVAGAPYGSLNAVAPTCAIGAYANTCSLGFNWSTGNPISTSAVTSYAGTEATGNTSSGSFSVPYGTNSKTFYLYNAGYLLAQTTVGAVCTGGTGWNGSVCVPPATVSLSSSVGLPLTYNTGTTISWSSSNATSCSSAYGGGSGATGSFATGALTSSQTYSITCSGPGGSGSASITASVNPAPTGTISTVAPSCSIGAGSNSCSLGFNWSTGNPISTSAVTSYAGTEANGNSGSSAATIAYGTNTKTLYLYNAGYLLAQTTASAVCAGGTSWNGSSCVPPAPAPALGIYSTWGIPEGSSSGYTYQGAGYTVSWGAVANATSCTLNGSAVSTSGGTSSGTADGWSGLSRTFTLTCSGLGGTGSSSNTLYYPPMPTITSVYCGGTGASATVTWTDPAGWGAFYPRATLNGTYQYPPTSDTTTGTSVTWATTPGQSYSFWIHTRNPSNGSWSAATSAWVTCANPAPSGTLTINDNWAYGAFQNSNISTYGWNTGVQLQWSSSDATACGITDNGAATGWGGTSGTVSVGGLGGTSHTYVLTCSNPYAGSTSVTRVLTIPSVPTSVSFNNTTCTGNSLTLNWNQNGSYGRSAVYIRDNGNTIYASDPMTGVGTSGSVTIGTTPGHTYAGEVYVRDGNQPSNPYSMWVSIPSVTCTLPPAPTLGIYSTWGIPDGSTTGTTYYASPWTVSWGPVANATSCTLDGVGVSTAGNIYTSTADGWAGNTHTFTLTCSGPGGTGTSTNVINYPPQPSVNSSVCGGLGTSATVNWTDPAGWNTFYTRAYTGPTQALYNDGATGTVSSFATSPGAAYDFWVHTRANNGAWSNAVHSYFTCSNPPPTVTVTANPTTIAWGATSTFSWTASNAASCSTPWASSTATSFGPVFTGTLYNTTTINVTCTNGGGSTVASATITVLPRPAPTVSVNANPTSVGYNGSSNITWTSTNADSCSSAGGGGTGAFGSFATPALTTNQTYTVTCTGNGTATSSVTVTVLAPTVTVTATPSTILYRNSSVITWTSTNAASCSSVSTPSIATSGSFTAAFLTGTTVPSTPKTYRVTCVGNGSVTGTAVVNVCAQRYTTTGACTKQNLKVKYKEK